MKRQKVYVLVFLIVPVLAPGILNAAENSASLSPGTGPALTRQQTMAKQITRDRVRELRRERANTMPYLDLGYIRSEINTQKVRQKTEFLSSGKKELKDIIRRAVQVHTPARAAHERMSLARRRILAAVRKLFPETKVELQKRRGSFSKDNFSSRSYTFSFRQPVFHGGVLWNSLLKEKAGLEAAGKEYDKTLADLVKDVTAAYFEYNRTRQVIEDQKMTLRKMRRFADISKRKFSAQLISEIEQLNVQSLFSQMEYDYETFKQELEIANLELEKYLNISSRDEIEIAEFYDLTVLAHRGNSGPDIPGKIAITEAYNFEGSIKIPSLGDLVDLAYQYRPELQIESSKLQAARLEERIQMGGMVPSADVVLEFGRLGEAFDINSRDPGLRREFRVMMEFNWNAAGNKINYTYENNQQPPSVGQFLSGSGSIIRRNTLTVGLLDGLDQWASIKEAEVAKLDQIVELEKAEKAVILEVKQAYFDFQKARIQVKSSLQRADYRERLARLAAHRLEQNEIQISEYFQAEIELLREKTELHKALKDYFTAKAKLNHAIGKAGVMPVEAIDGK